MSVCDKIVKCKRAQKSGIYFENTLEILSKLLLIILLNYNVYVGISMKIN